MWFGKVRFGFRGVVVYCAVKWSNVMHGTVRLGFHGLVGRGEAMSGSVM